MVDVKATIARLGFGATSARTEAPSQIEYLAWFRFPVTWNYLTESPAESQIPAAPKLASAAPTLTLAPIAAPAPRNGVPNAPAPDLIALDVAGTDDAVRPTTSGARWEMMVPKMTRPPAKLTASVSPAAVPALPAPPPKAAPFAPAFINSPAAPVSPLPAASSAPIQFSPTFSLHTPEDQFLARYWPQIVYVAIAITAIGCLIWGLSGPSSPAHSVPSSAATPQVWSHQPLSPSGRSLTLYEPSRSESDYRIEFSWVPDSRGIGWVFRTRDAKNYYAAHVTLEQHASGGLLVAEHFSVIAGTESQHSRKVIPFPANASLVRVHMDAVGSGFKLFLENNPADSWTDARLNSGAFGLYDDGVHNPKLLALSVNFIDNGVSRTSVVPLP